MSNKQKIWPWIFAGMFLVPEILWSPIGNFLYAFLKPTTNGNFQVFRSNFLISGNYDFLYVIVLVVQLIGILGSLFFTYKSKLPILQKVFLLFVLIILLIILILIFYIIYTMRNGIGF